MSTQRINYITTTLPVDVDEPKGVPLKWTNTDADYYWVGTDEPHRTRRTEIMKKHPELKELYGYNIWTLFVVILVVAIQIGTVTFVLDRVPWFVSLFLLYTVGGTLNHTLSLAIHELSHGLVMPRLNQNRLVAIFANLPLGVPMAMTFQQYHLEHHVYQGDEFYDVDIPSRWEAEIFRSTLLKAVWLFFQPVWYGLRPLFVHPKKPTRWVIFNNIVQISFDIIVFYTLGWKALAYLLFSNLLGMGWHPMAGHFIAEHYVFTKGQETYSYYGPLNILGFNVGYHNEHHDFPKIPGCNLPRVRAIASEYYDTLPYYTSWPGVLWRFITDPSVCLYSRVRRKSIKNKGQ